MTKTTTILQRPEDTIRVQAQLVALMPDLEKGKKYECIIKQHREKRSKNANDYSWVLQDEIAKVLNKPIDEVHEEMVLQYGVKETYSIKKECFSSAIRNFDYYKTLGESEVNGQIFIHVRAAIGTHKYDSKEMSDFINGVIQEAQNLDIDTKTPKEVAELTSLWERGER